jgi:NAD(P)-dependent dehydrogenase (short-subunit alcohol dehydrogenase family)/acyl carrier protein
MAPSGPVPVDDWFAVPTWREAPAPAAPVSFGRCLAFTGDGLAAELVAGLRDAGVDVVEVVAGDGYGLDAEGRYTLRPGDRADLEKLVADLAVAGGVPARVVHAWPLVGTPAGVDADAVWRAQETGLFTLLGLAQAVAASQLAEPVHLDVLTAGTEDVTGADLTRPEHATVAGIVRVLPLETADLTVRHVDLDPAEGRAAVDACLGELFRPPAGGAGDQVVLRAGQRWRRDYQPAPAPKAAAPAAGRRERGVYLLTGGLGGIGLAVAEDLARRVRARLVLFGRTGLPPRGEWDELLRRGGGADRLGQAITAVRRIEDAGGEVLVAAADVTDEAALATVRATALDRFGRIDGVVHAAGVAGGGMAEVRDRAAVERVLAPKLAGTLALARVFGGDDLDFVALFSSVTAVAAAVGQLDSCAAHAFLDAVARSGHGFRSRVLSVDWGGWLDVGMAAAAGPGAGEPVDHPLLRRRWPDDSLHGVLAPDTHWVLGEHRVGGVPMLPATAHLELMHRAVQELTAPPTPAAVVELRDVSFVRPLAVPGPAGAGVRVTATPTAAGWDVRVSSADGVHALATAGWVEPGPAPRHDLDGVRGRCAPAPPAQTSVDGEELLVVGPHWPVAADVRVGPNEQLARLELVDPPPGNYWLHPALLDRAVGFPQLDGSGWLPLGYGSLLARSPLPSRVYGHVRHTSRGDDLISADVTVTDEDGVELVAVSDFLLRRVPTTPSEPSASAWAAWAAAPSTGAAAPDPGAVGIRPAAGVDAFARLLATDLGPQVVVTPEPLAELLAKVRAPVAVPAELVEAGADDADLQPRLLDGDYVPPRTELEAALAAIWSDVLGIGQIGVTDDFFELGGDSLLGVQLVAAIGKAMGTRVPMRTLFDLPTVAQIAARIEELRGTPAATAPAEQPIPRLPRP